MMMQEELSEKENPDVGEKVIVIGISPEIPNDVIAVNADLSDELQQLILDGMVAFLAQGEESAEFLIYFMDGLLLKQ